VLEFPLPSSCPFSSFTSFLPASSSCIFGYSLPLEVSFNCLLPIFKFNCYLYFRTSQASIVFYGFLSFKFNCCFFRRFYLIINIYLLSLSNSLSIKNLAQFLILKIAILRSKSSKLIETSTFLASIPRLFSKLPTFITNFKANFSDLTA
jgi:hypothetical protein